MLRFLIGWLRAFNFFHLDRKLAGRRSDVTWRFRAWPNLWRQ